MAQHDFQRGPADILTLPNRLHAEIPDHFWQDLFRSEDPLGAKRAMLDAVPHMVWSTTPDGHHDFFNKRWYDFTGAPEGTTDGERWSGMFHPEDQPRAWQVWRECLATGEPYEIEYRLRHHSGDYRWTLGRAVPVRDGSGRIVRWFGTCTDVDDQKRAESAIELVAGELAHRINNIFTVVLSLLSVSARHQPEAAGFARNFADKVRALAKAHGMVRVHQRAGGEAQGSLLDLLRSLAEPYQADGKHAIDIAGDDARLNLQSAGAVALVVHELATNALKYGALAKDGGHVTLRTQVAGGMLRIQWVEIGGPPVSGPPQHIGFGSDMKRRAATLQLRGELVEDWDSSGLRVAMAFPLDVLGS